MTDGKSNAHGYRQWMTALEMQAATAQSLHDSLALPGGDVAMRTLQASCLKTIRDSQPFAWTDDTAQAVWTASRSIPDSAVLSREAFVGQLSWWWFDWPLPVPLQPTLRGLDVEENLPALLIALDSTHLTFGLFRRFNDGLPMPGPPLFTISNVSRIPFGVSLLECLSFTPPTGYGAAEPDVIRFLLAASAWLKQRILIESTGHVERHRRKQLARSNGPAVSDVRVIQLRRQDRSLNDTEAQDSSEWACRWVVSGHWRNQYHPSDGRHELTYILPYVKGPDDKPLKVPTQTVYSVSR